MAYYQTSYDLTLGHEGGYSNRKDDFGEETVNGISRKWHPRAAVWPIVDQFKAQNNGVFPKGYENKKSIKNATKEFYQLQFWDPINGHLIPNQDFADFIFDVGVNMGIGRAGRFAQTALNVLNNQERFYPDLKVDGDIGKKTLAAMNALIEKRGKVGIYPFLIYFSSQAGNHYINESLRRESQESNTGGWGARLARNHLRIALKYAKENNL